jgi:hypothetical protein
MAKKLLTVIKPYLRLGNGDDLKSIGGVVPLGTSVRLEAKGCRPGRAFKCWRDLFVYTKGDVSSFVAQAMQMSEEVRPVDSLPESIEFCE